MTSDLVGACADDVLMDAGNMHGGILFHDARRSIDGGIRHCENNVCHSQLSTHEAERELHQAASKLWFQREAGRLWFNVVTSNDARGRRQRRRQRRQHA